MMPKSRKDDSEKGSGPTDNAKIVKQATNTGHEKFQLARKKHN